MKTVTSRQMRDLDRATTVNHGVPSLALMERAGSGAADFIRDEFRETKGPVVVVAGKGNNGGDGLVVARHLILAGFDVSVVLLASPVDLSPDARANWELLAPITTRLFQATATAELNSHRPLLAQATPIIDAILGTGLKDAVTGISAAAIELINSLAVPVLSLDIPSGLDADTGEPLGDAVRAATTITFGLPKRGLFTGKGSDYAGRVEVVDIGIPDEEVHRLESDLELIEPSMFASHFTKRPHDAHKGQFGHIIVFAGSRGHLGAGYLACLAALRAGCGLVTYCLPAKAFVRFDACYAEVMCDPIPDGGLAHFHPSGIKEALATCAGKSAVAIGPAIGTVPGTAEFVNDFVRGLGLPLVIDADGLNCLSPDSVKARRAATVLTPHPGEMARLMGVKAGEVQTERIAFAGRLANSCNAIVILKGRGTIVARPDGLAAINQTGNAGMATAGMGDALTGVVTSFIAQGMDPWTASVAAVYIHGLAGDMAAAEHGERALITSDVIRCLGAAMKEVVR